jgi:hypothetical protein
LEVAVPLALPPSTDPAYFFTLNNGIGNFINIGVFTAFTQNIVGWPCPSITDQASCPIGAFVGLAPSAAPLPQPATPNYALCADLPDNTNGPGAKLRPAVAAYYAMATSGEMLLSAPLPSAFTTSFGGTPPVCPQL